VEKRRAVTHPTGGEGDCNGGVCVALRSRLCRASEQGSAAVWTTTPTAGTRPRAARSLRISVLRRQADGHQPASGGRPRSRRVVYSSCDTLFEFRRRRSRRLTASASCDPAQRSWTYSGRRRTNGVELHVTSYSWSSLRT